MICTDRQRLAETDYNDTWTPREWAFVTEASASMAASFARGTHHSARSNNHRNNDRIERHATLLFLTPTPTHPHTHTLTHSHTHTFALCLYTDPPLTPLFSPSSHFYFILFSHLFSPTPSSLGCGAARKPVWRARLLRNGGSLHHTQALTSSVFASRPLYSVDNIE